MKICIGTEEDRRCVEIAEFVVEKNNLSHEKGFYCSAHAKHFKSYPAYFSVTKIEFK